MLILQILIGLLAIIIGTAIVIGGLYSLGKLVRSLFIWIGLENKYYDLDWDDHLMNGIIFIFLLTGVFMILFFSIYVGKELLNLII